MKSTCTKFFSLICLILFSVQVIFIYGNAYEKSNPTASIFTESNNDGYNPFESSSDKPEQDDQEENQESEENEENNEIEVLCDEIDHQQNDFQLSELNYYYLLMFSEGVFNKKFSPPDSTA